MFSTEKPARSYVWSVYYTEQKQNHKSFVANPPLIYEQLRKELYR